MSSFHGMERESTRYCDINNLLSGISEKTPTAQPREMEQDGIIPRVVYPEVPPRVEYQLTSLGHSLLPVYDALMSWGEHYANNTSPDNFLFILIYRKYSISFVL